MIHTVHKLEEPVRDSVRRRPVVVDVKSRPRVVTLGEVDGQTKCWIGNSRVNPDVVHMALRGVRVDKDSRIPFADNVGLGITSYYDRFVEAEDAKYLRRASKDRDAAYYGRENRNPNRSRSRRMRARILWNEEHRGEDVPYAGFHGKCGQPSGRKPQYKDRGRDALRHQSVAGLTMEAAILSGMSVRRKWAEDDARLERELNKLERRRAFLESKRANRASQPCLTLGDLVRARLTGQAA